MVGPLEIRPAVDADLSALNDLYNHYARETHVTFDLEPMTVEARREWFTHYGTTGRHRLLVATEADRLLGYATSSPYASRAAYETSVQTSIYLAPDATGRGIGSRLYEALFQLLDGEDLHRAYAGVALPNPASVALHERFAFAFVGRFTEQGRKFGRYWDVAWYERPLESGSAAAQLTLCRAEPRIVSRNKVGGTPRWPAERPGLPRRC